MDKTNIDEIKLGGAKKKNGHKLNCSCHICENMKNKAKRGGYSEEMEKEVEYISGGSKKKNGHRKNCHCPICKNMKNAKRGGGDDEFIDQNNDQVEENSEPVDENMNLEGGKKRGNGHKPNCQCPICKNMRKSKKGGQPDEENQMGDIEEAGIKGKIEPSESNEIKASDEDYDELDAAEKGEHNPVGGTRRRRSNKKRSVKRRKTRRNRNSRKRRY
jgi:hypothetical protein